MTLNLKKYLIIAALFSSTLYGQDIHFSQIQESPLWLNPANAGLFDGYARAIINYRNQWMNVGSPYKTMAISVDGTAARQTKKRGYLGIGLMIFNDQAGPAKMGLTQLQTNFNGIVSISKKSKLAGAISAGFGQNKANLSTLTYGNQFNGTEIDPTITNGERIGNKSFSYIDLGAGLNYEYSNVAAGLTRDDLFTFKIGAAAHHLNKPTQNYYLRSTYYLPMRFVVNAQARMDFKGTKLSLLPSVVYMRQASATEITVGTHLRYRFKNGTKVTGISSEQGINFGVYYRVGDAIIPQINIDLGKYAVGVSYDINVSKFTQVTHYNGGIELYLKYTVLGDALRKRKREYGL